MVVAGLAVLAFTVLYFLVQDREKDLVTQVPNRVETSVAWRAEVLSTWIKGVAHLANQITGNGLFKLFAAEIDLAGEGQAMPAALRRQLPYMLSAVTDFAKKNGMVGAYMVGRDGRVYLASAAAPVLTPAQRQAARTVFETGERLVLPLRKGQDDLVLDIVLPLTAPQTVTPDERKRTVGVMLITHPAAKKLEEILYGRPVVFNGGRVRLLQEMPEGVVEVSFGNGSTMTPVANGKGISATRPFPFGRRVDVSGRQVVFSKGAPVPGTSWLVIQQVAEDRALEPLMAYRLAGVMVAILATLLVGAAFVAVWWRQNSEAGHALARQFHNLAARIQTQRQLLDSVNNSIEECIGLKGLDGRYVYVNPSFARLAGKSADGIVGSGDEAVFGGEAAARLKIDDQKVLSSGAAVTCDIHLDIRSKRHFFTMSKAPLKSDDDVIIGIVSVARDVTEILEQQRRLDAAAEATTAALVHAIEMHDPYLAGHSQRMGEMCRNVGSLLRLTDEDLATLEMAANLSQIGKLSIPVNIITKDTRLSRKEIEIVRGHIRYAEKTLEVVNFSLPVTQTVLQMHERLDGSGYPKGLGNDEIDMRGRIIAVCDVYCARIAPRGYRGSIPPEEALTILQNNPEKYDQQVVAALRRCV